MPDKEKIKQLEEEIAEYKRLSIQQNKDREENFRIQSIMKTANTRAIITWIIIMLVLALKFISGNIVFDKETIEVVIQISLLSGVGVFLFLNSMFAFIGSFSENVVGYSATKIKRSALIFFLCSAVFILAAFLNASRGGLI